MFCFSKTKLLPKPMCLVYECSNNFKGYQRSKTKNPTLMVTWSCYCWKCITVVDSASLNIYLDGYYDTIMYLIISLWNSKLRYYMNFWFSRSCIINRVRHTNCCYKVARLLKVQYINVNLIRPTYDVYLSVSLVSLQLCYWT